METNNRFAGKKVLRGVITSTKSAKTIVVSVEKVFIHPIYKKRIILHTKFHAHDEKEIGSEGDIVKIISCRPLSAKKRWRLLEIIQESNK